MLATGLRVSELSQITKKACLITNDRIIFSFIGKGGNEEEVFLNKQDDPKLYIAVKELIESSDKKVFYSAIYLQTKAKELGFKCHDLRRAMAKLEYRKSKSKNVVMKKLRHSSMKNTNIYIKSKVKL